MQRPCCDCSPTPMSGLSILSCFCIAWFSISYHAFCNAGLSILSCFMHRRALHAIMLHASQGSPSYLASCVAGLFILSCSYASFHPCQNPSLDMGLFVHNHMVCAMQFVSSLCAVVTGCYGKCVLDSWGSCVDARRSWLPLLCEDLRC